jgi:hypothetical protein
MHESVIFIDIQSIEVAFEPIQPAVHCRLIGQLIANFDAGTTVIVLK